MTNSLPLFGQARGKLPLLPQGDGLFASPTDGKMVMAEKIAAGLTVLARKVEIAQSSSWADSGEASDGKS